MLRRILTKIDEWCSIHRLIKVIGVLSILFLLLQTQTYWGHWVSLLRSIVQPFLIGFVIAYVMNPFVKYLQKKGLPKNLVIILLWIIVIVGFIVLIMLLLPILYEKINEFMSSMIDGVYWISKQIKAYGKFENFSLIDSITQNVISLLKKYDDWVPQIVSTLPNIMSIALSVITNVLFSVIIGIYMLFDFDRIRASVKRTLTIVIPKSGAYLHEIDENVTVYLKSLIIIMVIKFVEYSLFYFALGHPDWVIIGILTSIGALIPYLGGTIANSIGVITALTLGPSKIFALILGILVLSNVDAYLISPLVHEKRSALGPLTTLFAIFAGGILLGPIGIMVAVPFTIILKTIATIHVQDEHQPTADHSS